MKTIWSLSLMLAGLNVDAANILEVLECHDRVVQHGVQTASFVKEVNSLFGRTNVDHFISDFNGKTHTAVWNSVAYFAGRYQLSLHVPIEIDHENCRLMATTSALAVQINEVVQVELSASGIAGATLRGQWRLNEDEWSRLVNSNGDWSVVNVPILTNAPVKLFEEHVRQSREPIRNRKAGFDDPIRTALQSLRDGTYLTNSTNVSADCSSRLSCYEQIICHGRHDVLPKQFEAFFGPANVDHFISKFGSRTQAPVWHSIAYFGGRYRAALQFPLSIDYKNCKPNGAINSTFIQIDEITRVNPSKAGLKGVVTKGQWQLGEAEWKWLLKNNGDWSVVKVPIQTNVSIRGFNDYVRRERARPIRDRQEDFDEPIRKDVDALPYPQINADQR